MPLHVQGHQVGRQKSKADKAHKKNARAMPQVKSVAHVPEWEGPLRDAPLAECGSWKEKDAPSQVCGPRRGCPIGCVKAHRERDAPRYCEAQA
jgi:hypothetical protein